MARIWKERHDSSRHRNISVEDYWRAPTLLPHDVINVHVCSFTFQFHSIDEIRDYLQYFEKNIHPSGRKAMPPNADVFDHWHAQSEFEKLPMYLFEEPKRRKVVKALVEALRKCESGNL